MGLMDKLKGLIKGREPQVKKGIDSASDQIEKRVGPQHAGKVDGMSDKAKDQVDKLAGGRPETVPPAGTVTPPSTTTPVAPPPDAPPI